MAMDRQRSLDCEGARLELVQGDITLQRVDAIVNAANPDLTPGGGVSGAIHRAGGPTLTEAAAQLHTTRGSLATGAAVPTPGGDLPARHVIHTVGPVWQGGTRGEPELLARAYTSCLRRAVELGARSVAFPSISTGVYGYPVEPAARVALWTVIEYLNASRGQLDLVRFVLFSTRDLEIYAQTLEERVHDRP